MLCYAVDRSCGMPVPDVELCRSEADSTGFLKRARCTGPGVLYEGSEQVQRPGMLK